MKDYDPGQWLESAAVGRPAWFDALRDNGSAALGIPVSAAQNACVTLTVICAEPIFDK